MEMQAEMFNQMCSIRSSEMNIDEPECKDENDDQSVTLGLFNNQLWKDPCLGSPIRSTNMFHNTYKSENV